MHAIQRDKRVSTNAAARGNGFVLRVVEKKGPECRRYEFYRIEEKTSCRDRVVFVFFYYYGNRVIVLHFRF